MRVEISRNSKPDEIKDFYELEKILNELSQKVLEGAISKGSADRRKKLSAGRGK